MNETIQLLGELLNTAGFWAVLGVGVLAVVVTRAGKIGEAFERLLCRFFPSYKERAQVRREVRERIRENGIQEQVDIKLVMQGVITDARMRLDSMEARLDRRDTELYGTIRRYERLGAAVMEVLQDISNQIRAQTNLLNSITKGDTHE